MELDINKIKGVAMKLLKEKLIFITGGSLGIGFEIAKKCVENGAKVIIASRTEKDLKLATGKLNNISNEGHEYRVLDTGDKTQVKQCAKEIQQKFGYMDGLVNCAGVYGPIGRIDEIDVDKFTEAININFLGTVYMCHYFVPLMKNRHAKIVNYSGGGAAGPFPNYSAYATSKIAIIRLTENMSKELADFGIEVNAVAPGFVVTRLHQETLKAGQKAGQAFLEKTKQEIEKGGVPPEKAAELTAFLLSNKSNGITGRFISAPWDNWKEFESNVDEISNSSLYTLRRVDGRNFVEVKK